MKSKKAQENARFIINYYRDHQNDRKRTVKHFVDQGVPERTIRHVIKRWSDEQRVDYDMNSGPERTARHKNNLKKIRNQFVSNPSTSNRKVAEKVHISERSVRRAKCELGIRSRKKVKFPKHVNDQAARCKTNAWKLYQKTTPAGGSKTNNFFLFFTLLYIKPSITS